MSGRNQTQRGKFFEVGDKDDYFASLNESSDCISESNNSEDEEEKKKFVEECKEKDDNNAQDDDEEDPLDAYMNSLQTQERTPSNPKKETSDDKAQKCSGLLERDNDGETSKTDSNKRQAEINKNICDEKKGIRLDLDDSNDIEQSYYDFINSGKRKSTSNQRTDSFHQELQDLVEYDLDGNILSTTKMKKEIDPLPSIDHTKINYEQFERCFYVEHEDIKNLTEELVEDLRKKLDLKVTGNNLPKPVCSFAHFGFEEKLLRVIRRSEYTSPTPIQAQAIPAALVGRNVLGIAMTGSGKTAAYLWPMIIHIVKQRNNSNIEGPIGLVLVPTRELALQVYTEAKRFSSSYNMKVICAYGGGSKYEQSKDLEQGADIVIATPGRLIDLVREEVTNLRYVTYLVLDEADRFFEMGFEQQVRSICDHVRPDRQTLLFSATFKHKIEKLARSVIKDPVKIVQKALGEANEDVTQHIVVLADEKFKWDWLIERLEQFKKAGSSLVFVTRIANADELYRNLQEQGHDSLLLHGDMDQCERNRVMKAFKLKEKILMIATDVAARGLDISHIKTVINYDIARDIDTHVHRIGRTGRAGNKGDAHTLITPKDKEFAGHLVKNLEASNQEVPEELLRLAMQSYWFRKQQSNQNRGKKYNNSSSGYNSQKFSRTNNTSRNQPHQQMNFVHQPPPPYNPPNFQNFRHQSAPRHEGPIYLDQQHNYFNNSQRDPAHLAITGRYPNESSKKFKRN